MNEQPATMPAWARPAHIASRPSRAGGADEVIDSRTQAFETVGGTDARL